MKTIFLIISLLCLFSCKSTSYEVWTVECDTINFSDTIITPEGHWHFQDRNNIWTCAEYDSDTSYLELNDTIPVRMIKLGTIKEQN
jgi:hypothetical protein